MVYSEYGNGLLEPNLWFRPSKPMVWSDQSMGLAKTSSIFGKNRAFLSQGRAYLFIM